MKATLSLVILVAFFGSQFFSQSTARADSSYQNTQTKGPKRFNWQNANQTESKIIKKKSGKRTLKSKDLSDTAEPADQADRANQPEPVNAMESGSNGQL